MGTATGTSIARALVFRECGAFSRLFGGHAGATETLGDVIAKADKSLALDGDLVAYFQGRPCVPEKVNAMAETEWNRFLNRRFRQENWRRVCLDTAHGRCCVAVALDQH